MTTSEAENILIEVYKLDKNKDKYPISKPWSPVDGFGPSELYIPLSVVIEALQWGDCDDDGEVE
jgi:hypothetical protein